MSTQTALRVDSERTRLQILTSARQLFHELGYEQVRMSDVATQVGCSRATVYNHFSSRDELLKALCVEYLEGYLHIHERIGQWIRPEHTVFEVLRETIAEELRWRAANGALRNALDTARQQRKDFYVEGNKRIDDAMLAWFGSIYVQSARAGLLRPQLEITFATHAVYAMVDHVVAGFDVNTPVTELARAADQVAYLQWHALYLGDPSDAPPFQGLHLSPPEPRSKRRRAWPAGTTGRPRG